MHNMMSRRSLVTVASLGAGLLAAGCGLIAPQWRYRYRLTATLVRDGQAVRGSSIVEIERRQVYGGIGGRTNGEAAVVDLLGIGTLFVLLSSEAWGVNWPVTIPHYAFRRELGSVDMVNGAILDRLSNMVGVRALVPPEYYPSLVRFRDLRDPASVEALAPADFPRAFVGFALRDIALEIVREAPRQSIYARLPWLRAHKGALTRPDLTKPVSENPFSARINEADFIMGSIR